MKEDRVRYFNENMERLSRTDKILLNNPVIMQGLGLAPIVIAATTVPKGLVIALTVLLLLTPTRMIASMLVRATGMRFRAGIYTLTASVVYIGVAYLLDRYIGFSNIRLGIYLPLLVMEPLIIKRYSSQQKERLGTAFRKGIITTAGFCLVLMVMASLREILAFGTFAGVEVTKNALLPLAGQPAGGFILLGLVAALWRGLVNSFKKKVSLGVKKLS